MDVFLLPTSAHPAAFQSVLSELLAAKDEETLARITVKIRHVAGSGGHPQAPYSRRLQGVDLCEIRSKYHHEELIRIYYYVDRTIGKMLLLNYIIKPDGSNNPNKYEGKAGKRIEKEIQESIDLAVQLQALYPPTHPVYEPFALE